MPSFCHSRIISLDAAKICGAPLFGIILYYPIYFYRLASVISRVFGTLKTNNLLLS